MKLSRRLMLLLAIPALLGGAALALTLTASAQSNLPKRAYLAMVASDGLPVVSDVPPPDPSYCAGGTDGGSTPPDAVFGTLRISGSPAPVGTLVQITFDGVVGPGIRVREAGGYRIDYGKGGGSCSNKIGATIGLLINGTPVATTKKVGDADITPFFRFDVNQ